DTSDGQNATGDNPTTQRAVAIDTVEDQGDVLGRRGARVHLGGEGLEAGAGGHGTAVVGEDQVLQRGLGERGVDLHLALGQSTTDDVHDLVNFELGVVKLQLQGHATVGAAEVGPLSRDRGVRNTVADISVSG